MNITWGLLSKYRNELYGFSIIWIILFHGLGLKCTAMNKYFSFLSGFIEHGNCGVDIFLFLSGISLYFSLKNNDDIVSFYKKRLAKIFFPFLAIDGIYWLYVCIYKRGDFIGFVKNITFYSFWAGNNRIVWFIALILVLYLIYPFILELLCKKNPLLYIIFLIVSVYIGCYVLNMVSPKWFKGVEVALTRIPVFLVGCYLGRKVYENVEISSTVKIMTLVFVVYGFYYFYQHPYSLLRVGRIPYLFIGPSLALWICIVLDVINSQCLKSVLSTWGGLSLELYLSHTILKLFFEKSSYLIGKSGTYNFFKYIIFVFFGSFLVSKIVQIIYSKLKFRRICNLSRR